jgi:hypothetical protein
VNSTPDADCARESAPVGVMGHPIAPTEFPKRWSATDLVWPPEEDDPEPATYNPREEDTGESVTSTNRRLPAAAYPRKSDRKS